MARRHGVTANTYKKLIIDSGAVYKNYGEAGEALMGATRGGNEFSIETEIREMPVDGAKGAVKGFDRITKVTATLKIKLLEMSKDALLWALTGSTAADYPSTPAKTHDQITRSLALTTSAYLTNVALVGEVTGNATYPVIVYVKNAIANSNLTLSFADSEESVSEITFRASFDPAAMDTEPWEIRFPVIS